MALGGFMGGVPSGGNLSPSNSFGGFGSQRISAEAARPVGGGNRIATNSASPMSAYGREFTFTDEELKNAALSQAGILLGSRLNPTVGMLYDMQKKTNASPELQGVLNAIQAPFKAGYQSPSVPSGLLDNAIATASPSTSGFPKFDRLTSVPSYAANANSVMGLTVGSPYNNITNDFAPASSPVNGPAGMTFNALSPTAVENQYQSTPSYVGLENAVMGNTMGSPLNNVIQYGMPTTGTVQDLPGALRNPLLPSSPMRYHAGVDIKTEPGTPAVSMVPGTVAQLGTAGGYGSFVDIMNYDGTMTRYATHLGVNPDLKVGDIVSQGQNLGPTGAVKGGNFSHLHMEQMTPSDRAFQEIAAAYNSGATAARPAAPGNVYGITSSYDPNNIQTSTAGLLDRLNLSTGTQMAMGPMTQAPTQVASAPSPAPVQPVAPQDQARVAATPSLPPRTPTPSLLGRFATALTGIPGYDTGPGLLGGGFKPAEVGTQLLAGAQPQVVEAASAPEAPPAVRPAAEPVSLASLLIDRAISRGEDRKRRKRMSTTVEQMQRDTIGGLLA